MPRKNIFNYEKLTLNYKGDSFFLLKNNNSFGSKYNLSRVQQLIITIKKEMQKSEHEMEYNLKEFKITPSALETIKNYKTKQKSQKLEKIINK